ncbi:MAG: CarD family transcriptional regulator [Lachnospiraceae bacterium]|nr:CarD family transcriptional regulator [Lachnospiraceae bacterium]
MFQKKEYIFNENMGVCIVADIVKLSADKSNPVLYYVLRPLKNKEKVSYIPVENHQVVLRKLIDPEEARQRLMQGEKLGIFEKEEVEFVLRDDTKG